MKTQASVLAALLGSAAAQTAADKAKGIPRFQAATQDVQCSISANTDVSDAAQALATAKQAVDDWKKDGGALALAEAQVVSDRAARDAAVAAVLVKDDAFKTLLTAAQGQEETVMGLYATAMAAKKLHTDAEEAEATALAIRDLNAPLWTAADADKTAADTAVSLSTAHLLQETTAKTAAMTAWRGAGVAEAGTPLAGSALKAYNDALAYRTQAVADLNAALTPWQTKVDEIAAALILQDTPALATRLKVSAAKLVTSQTAVNGASNTAVYSAPEAVTGAVTAAAGNDSLNKVLKTALDANDEVIILDGSYNTATYPGNSASVAYTALGTAATLFKTKGKVLGLIAKARKEAEDAANGGTFNTAGLTAAFECATVSCAAGTAGDLNACKTECKAKALPTGLLASNATNTYCTGIIHQTGNTGCELCHGGIATGVTGVAKSGYQCYSREGAVQNEAFYTGTVVSDFTGATTGLITTLNTAWKVKNDAVVAAKCAHDTGIKILLYLTSQYQDGTIYLIANQATATTGMKTYWDTLNSDWTTKTNALGALLTTANNAGKVTSNSVTVTVSAVAQTKTYATFESEYTTTKAATEEAEAAYTAAKAEVTTQEAMDVITGAWKAAALVTYNAINPLVKTVNNVKGYEALYTDASGVTATKLQEYNAALALYTAEIAKSTYIDAITNAEDGTNALGLGTAPAIATGYQEILTERAKVPALTNTLNLAITACGTARTDLGTKEAELKTKQGLLETALEACEASQYKTFQETYNTAVTTRGTTLTQIGETIKTQKTARAALKDGSGAAGARCERPRSNGDKRDRTLCDVEKELCCGSASKTVGLVQMTIETCQKSDTKKYDYQPERQPLKTGLPGKEPWDFACIDAAHRVLVALAVATSVGLMMQ